MSTSTINELEYRRKIDSALERIKKILGDEKVVVAPSQSEHVYEDKYLLAESMCHVALASHLNFFSSLGFNRSILSKMKEWRASSETVTLRFCSEEKCSFIRKETREEESPTQHVTESQLFGKIVSKVTRRVDEYLWKLESSWEIIAFGGVASSPERLCGRRGEIFLKTTSENSPYPALRSPLCQYDVDITWFIDSLESINFSPRFNIDRCHLKTFTPTRNPSIESALTYNAQIRKWCGEVQDATNTIYKRMDHKLMQKYSLHGINDPSKLFVPVVPLFQSGHVNIQGEPLNASIIESSGGENIELSGVNKEEGAGEGNNVRGHLYTGAEEVPCDSVVAKEVEHHSQSTRSVCLDSCTLNKFLDEERRLLDIRCDDMTKSFPDKNGVDIYSSLEASVLVLTTHMNRVCIVWIESLLYIESMLRSQLITAIGHEVTADEFGAFMSFHNRKFFNEEYRPCPMVHTVRRSPLHSPEGVVSIERVGNMLTRHSSSSNVTQAGSLNHRPIETFCALRESNQEMGFSISSSTRIVFQGDRFVHGWLRHSFNNDQKETDNISLIARSRQFCGYIVIVGKIIDGNNLDPQHSFLVQNRDEVNVPLSVSTLPTAKEFNDSIQSLSPDQRRFAEAFRSMQLGATLMGVLVVQVKPQLEVVLNLPEDSLTKEIKLTKDLFSLFVNYQIPSDLLSFSSENENLSTVDKVAKVKSDCDAMLSMVDNCKKEEIAQQVERAKYDNPKSSNYSHKLQSEDSSDEDGWGDSRRKTRGGSSRRLSCAEPDRVTRGFDHVSYSTTNLVSTRMNSRQDDPVQESSPLFEKSSEVRISRDYDEDDGLVDFSRIPVELDSRAFELDQSLRPTIVKPKQSWSKKAGKPLVKSSSSMNNSSSKSSSDLTMLGVNEQRMEREKAFDLLDALTRSGSLPLSHTTLHVIISATLRFDDSVMDTIIQKNVNPIERAERSSLVLASVVHGQDRNNSGPLVNSTHLTRAMQVSPLLFVNERSEDL